MLRNMPNVSLLCKRMQAAPTQAVMAHEAFKAKKAKLAAKSQAAVLDKYGNAAAQLPDADLLLPESEAYVEYDRTCASTPLQSSYCVDLSCAWHVRMLLVLAGSHVLGCLVVLFAR